MAATLYRSKLPITNANRRVLALEGLATLCKHLVHMPGINIQLLDSTQPDNYVYVTLSNPLPADQVDHLDLEIAP